jgi:hypothetical protein
MAFIFLNHLAEVVSCNGLTEFYLDQELLQELLGEFSRLKKIRSPRASVYIPLIFGDFDAAEPEFFGSVSELVEDDFAVLEDLLVDNF